MQYEVDDWSRFDFLKDARDPAADIIPGIDTGTLYFFSADEFNDGSLAYGGEYEVILADGPAVFGFRNSGRVYGANSTLERFKNKYYYNGLRLHASSDIGYGIVDIDRSNTDSYVVVDSTGRIVKGKKLALKDAEGYWILINDDRFIARVSDGVKPRWHNGQFYTFDPQRRGNDRYVSPIAPDFLTNVSSDFVVFEHDEP